MPRSAFNLFQKEAYFKTEDVGGFSELTKAYSKAWDALGETEKKVRQPLSLGSLALRRRNRR